MRFPSEYPRRRDVIQSEAKDLGNIRQKTSSYRNFSTEAHCNYLMLSKSELPEEEFAKNKIFYDSRLYRT